MLVEATSCLGAEVEWGTVKGRVIVEGEIPKLKPLVEKGAANVKDAACCAAQEIPDEKYVVDPETKGLANVVIYLQRKPAKVHPELVKNGNDKVKEDNANQNMDEVALEQKKCQFVPRIVFLQTGQQIRVFNKDPVGHNVHSNPLKNAPVNMITRPMEKNGVITQRITVAERLPFKIVCDIHPWMTAYCIALDHPYCAVTDETGSFEIEKLPAGTHDLVVWHESAGYIEKKYTVTIDKTMVELEPLTVEIQ